VLIASRVTEVRQILSDRVPISSPRQPVDFENRDRMGTFQEVLYDGGAANRTVTEDLRFHGQTADLDPHGLLNPLPGEIYPLYLSVRAAPQSLLRLI